MHISLISYFIENNGNNDSDGAVSTIIFNQNSAPVLMLFEISNLLDNSFQTQQYTMSNK